MVERETEGIANPREGAKTISDVEVVGSGSLGVTGADMLDVEEPVLVPKVALLEAMSRFVGTCVEPEAREEEEASRRERCSLIQDMSDSLCCVIRAMSC